MSRMVPRVTSASVHLKEMRNKDGKILAILEIRNFKVECCCEKSASSQYANKVQEEEMIHIFQARGDPGYGFEDMYSIGSALDDFQIVMDRNDNIKIVDILCSDKNEVNCLVERMRIKIDEERYVSENYWNQNWAYSEFDAKKRVGFREAYLYHCCYDRNSSGPPRKISKKEIRERMFQ